MEYQEITNLLSNIPGKVPRFIAKKWIEVCDQSKKSYGTHKQIIFKTPMVRSDLCDYSDAYIVVKGTVNIIAGNNNIRDKKNSPLAFKIMHHLFLAFQKLIIHLLTIQKI